MSYDSAKDIPIKDVFSLWYADNTPDSTLADWLSPYLRNARLFWKSTESRMWHTLHATLTGIPLWIGTYLRANPVNNVMIVRANQSWTSKLASVTTDWTVTNITTGTDIASDNRMEFVNIGDVLYCMNGSDWFWKLSWTTYTVPSTGISSFAPSFWVVFNSSLFVSWWSTNSNKVYKSVADNYEDFSSTGSDNFTFWEQIRGIEVANESLFYFTENTISVTGKSDVQDTWTALTYITRWVEVKWWAVNNSSIVSAGTNLYYLTPNNKICILTLGSNQYGFEVLELSHRKYKWIDRIMASLDSNQTDSFWYFLKEENLIKWFVKSRGATFNDICIVYDLIKDAFLVDDNKYFFGWVSFANKNYTISHIEAKVYRDEYGYDDEWAEINFRYETKYFDFEIPTRKKELWESRTFCAINNLAELTQSIIIDGNTVDTKIIDKDNIPIITWGLGTKEIGTFAVWAEWDPQEEMFYVDLIRTKGNLQVKGKKIKYVFTNSTIWGRVRLEDLEMKIEVLPPESNNLTL